MTSCEASASLSDPRIHRHPIDLPRLPAVGGERLFEATGILRHVGNHEAHEDGLPFPGLLPVELAAAVLELTDHRRRHAAAARTGEVQTPLADLRVVET